MSNGRPARLSARDVFPALLCVVTLTLAGCQRLPVRPIGPAALVTGALRENPGEPPLAGDDDPETARTAPAKLPPLPAEPTPLLDSAIARARGEEWPLASAPAPFPVPDEAKAPLPDHDVRPASVPMTERPQTAEIIPAAELPPFQSPVLLPAMDASPENPPKASPKPTEPEKPVPPQPLIPEKISERDEWVEGLGRLRELAKQKAHNSADDAATWKTRSGLLDRIAEDPSNDPVWSSVLPVLTAAPVSGQADADTIHTRVRAASDALDALAPFEITDLRLCRTVQGYGAFESLDPVSLKAGQPVVVYCELSGLRYEPVPEKGEFRSKLSSRVEIAAKGGKEPIWSQSLGTDDLCQRRRHDVYVNYRITLPDTLRPGDYELRLTQTDDLARRSVAAAIDIRVQP